MACSMPCFWPTLMADEGKSLGQLVAALQSEYGPHYYARRDLRIPNEVKDAAISRAGSEETTSLGSYKVLRKENLDGIKFFLDAPIKDKGADAWVLLRSSGTEPLMRIYVEACISRRNWYRKFLKKPLLSFTTKNRHLVLVVSLWFCWR